MCRVLSLLLLIVCGLPISPAQVRRVTAVSQQDAVIVLRFSIYPTGTTGESYYFELYENGALFGAVGARAGDDISEPCFLIETDHSSTIQLPASDFELLLSICDELEASGYSYPKESWLDAWDVGLLLNGKVYEASYWMIGDNEVFKTLIDEIIRLSPIEVDIHGWA